MITDRRILDYYKRRLEHNRKCKFQDTEAIIEDMMASSIHHEFSYDDEGFLRRSMTRSECIDLIVKLKTEIERKKERIEYEKDIIDHLVDLIQNCKIKKYLCRKKKMFAV